jgi:NhaP-type Na+/H+ or K+/H+ antiporter
MIRILSFMCECFIFLYLGLGLLSFGNAVTYDPLYIFSACLSILISRSHVFIILNIANWIPGNEKIPLKNQILIWFSGLRGAVAFALGVTFLELPNFSKETKGVIFGTTVMVVVLTVLILGGLTPYMLVWLKITTPETGDEEHGDKKGEEEDHEDDYELAAKTVSKPIFGWLYRIDATYIRPHFTDLSKDRVAQIVRKLSQSETEFIPLQAMGEKTKSQKELKRSESVKAAQVEEGFLEAISLN